MLLLMLAAAVSQPTPTKPSPTEPDTLPEIATDTLPPQPYPLGTVGTPDGARRTVERLFAATDAADDAAFDRVGRGLVVMLAPDFGNTVRRAEFAEALRGCTDRHVTGAKPYARTPPAQVVRVTLRCPVDGHQQDVEADVLADDAHAFAFLPGGAEAIWPEKPAGK